MDTGKENQKRKKVSSSSVSSCEPSPPTKSKCVDKMEDVNKRLAMIDSKLENLFVSDRFSKTVKDVITESVDLIADTVFKKIEEKLSKYEKRIEILESVNHELSEQNNKMKGELQVISKHVNDQQHHTRFKKTPFRNRTKMNNILDWSRLEYTV